MTGTDWVLVVGAIGLVIKEALAIYYSNKRAEAAEKKTDLIAAKVDHTADKVAEVAKVQDVVKTNTDGALLALKASNEILLETTRRQDLIIATFTAVKAATAAPPPLQEVTNGRAHEVPAEPVAVEVVNMDESAIPVNTARKAKE